MLNAVGAAYLDPATATAERVEDLLGRMTLAEKVGQMTQAERLGLQSPAQIADLGLGLGAVGRRLGARRRTRPPAGRT